MATWKQKRYPTKTTVNLVIRERSAYQLSRVLCGCAIVLVLVCAFCKFAVIDRLQAAAQAGRDAAAQEAYLAQLQLENEDYEAVQTEYAKYFASGTADGQTVTADCMEVLQLVEEQIRPDAGVSSLLFENNVLTLQLTGTDLSRASGILAGLSQSAIVSTVELATADDGGAQSGKTALAGATITMTITLKPEGGESK